MLPWTIGQRLWHPIKTDPALLPLKSTEIVCMIEFLSDVSSCNNSLEVVQQQIMHLRHYAFITPLVLFQQNGITSDTQK